ncbi:MAG: SusC/RagA family TonB-linked outer membrane protein [Bacteroidota bacterium]
MKLRKIVLFSAMLIGWSVTSLAQSKIVSGKVTGANDQPISGATIKVEGSASAATSTNDKGEFKISAKEGNVLQISSVGFKSTSVRVTAAGNYNVNLEVYVNIMDEVVVTAGGIKTKRKEIGTGGTVIKADNLIAAKPVTVAGGLQGKVAGLQINATNGGVNPSFRLVLRGQRSLTGNNQALVVLDNVIVPNEVLGNLNPEDVESVNVLNGAGAAALYGSSASNGALIVTTKKGVKGASVVNFQNTNTWEKPGFFPKFQRGFGAGGSAYGYWGNFSYLENQSYGPAFDNVNRPIGAPLENGKQDSAVYGYSEGHTKFWETGMTNQTDFSISSGDDNSTLYMSGQYVTVTGTTPGDKYNRTNFRMNGTRKVSNKINLSYSSSYTQNRYDITTQTGSMYGNMLNMPNNVDVTKYKDWRNNEFANPIGFYNPWYLNPYFTADNWRSNVRNDYFVANLEVKYTPIQGLDIVARQGITTRNTSNKDWVGQFLYTAYAKTTDQSSKSDIAASVNDGTSYTTNLLTDFFAQYQRKISDFSLNVIGGTQWRQDQAKSIGISANGLVIPGLYNVSNGVGTPGAGESNYMARQLGVYADARVGYKGFAFLHVTGRKDWVSILAKDNNSFFYPAADVSFIATDAIGALKNNKVLSYLKLRAGWSKVGQVNLGGVYGAYQLLPTFNSGAYGFPYGTMAGYSVGNTLVAPNLQPEITKGIEVGFDLNLFRDKFTSNVTYFDTKTDNQTVTTSISSSTGFTGLRTNTGQTSSKGLELTAHYTVIDNRRNKGLTLTVGGNYTYLDNNVNFISDQLPRLALATYGSTAGSYAVANRAFPVIMGYDYKRDAGGHVIVNPTTGIPTKSDTISVLGSAVVKDKIGLDLSAEYKGFRLSVVMEYRGGYSAYQSMGTELDWSGTGWRTAIYDRKSFVFPNSVYWDGAKYVTNTNVSIANGNGNNGFWTDGINRDVTSNYVTSGAFWKLREVSLSYSLPSALCAKTKVFKGITVSAQGRNLLILMAKDNYYTDPEYQDAGSGSNGVGLTGINQSPPSKFYGASIKFTF